MNIVLSREKIEIITVVITGMLKFLLVDFLNAKFWFILLAGIFWFIYILSRIKTDKSVLAYWGFQSSGFWKSVSIISVPAIIITILSVVYGSVNSHLVFNWHIIPIMILYPLWGTIQQFLILSLFGGNLGAMKKPELNSSLVVFLTSILFGIVHYPSVPLIFATFSLAIFYMLLFLRYKNIWALGLFHGWLACIFYFFALGRDPWLEFVNTI